MQAGKVMASQKGDTSSWTLHEKAMIMKEVLKRLESNTSLKCDRMKLRTYIPSHKRIHPL
jgi:hypothetical protein